ncbi:hypothetical protein EYB26_008567 [Talaromyces marneffei]|uniref:uncharacterized protein n=1 Tax=Talaromyces marneffei TaxID=37727 RepID=UPI0012A9EEFF|nr:uncharacterized protein EYB26_008567 [Talaromyces marneffei]QGA20857.1 hypothetical protein EYB26_008567 [Talaromyces marneffei]
MSGFYPHQGQRAMDNGMDEELARQYYTCMGYQIGSPSMTSQFPTAMLDATGYVPANSVSSSDYHGSQSGRHYQNPYTMSSHPTATMQEYHSHQLMASSPPSYPGYIPESAYQTSMPYPHAQHDEYLLQDHALRRQISPSDAQDLEEYGIQDPSTGTWRCRYPGCTSKAVFTRACDLRKHFNRHKKHLFCRFDGCPQATDGGFSSKKDRARHEAKHNPQIPCEWEGCDRVFSRVDNMKDHVRRIHVRGSR